MDAHLVYPDLLAAATAFSSEKPARVEGAQLSATRAPNQPDGVFSGKIADPVVDRPSALQAGATL